MDKPFSNDIYKEVENKLLILYLLDKMDIPLSNSQISQFALEENLLSFFQLQQALSEMLSLGYIEKIQDYNSTRYSLTDEGMTTLEYFEKHIPQTTRAKINKFVTDNRKMVKKEYEITANYFFDHSNNEFLVKCGIYEEEMMLMEINLSVVTREQAKLICNNWKGNVNKLYDKVLNELINCSVGEEMSEESSDDEGQTN